ncbi:hypothetical protein [Aureibaculum conchae]|uniref:hypothetical protein n=1 Tax=Aureibaculum sp. 2308TA14-22 TaxID=3108392 RepID=UPI0033926FB3
MKILKHTDNQSKESKTFRGKKLVIGGLMALLTVGTFAQNQKREFEKPKLTPDQIAELQTKKMTLGLELNESQQKKIYKLNKENAIEREAKRKERMALREKGEKPTGDDLFTRKNTRLDKALAHQKEMKSILNDSQYETWKKSRKHKAHKMKKVRKHKKMRQHQKGKKRQERKGQGSKE